MKIKLAFRFHTINALAVFFSWLALNFYFHLIQTLTIHKNKGKETFNLYPADKIYIHQKGKVIKNPTKITTNLP